MRVLVIGGGGFIGRNTAEHLLRSEHDVRIYTKTMDAAPLDCIYYCRDLMADECIEELLEGVQAVLYFVTVSTPLTSMKDPSLVYNMDIPMLVKVLDACVRKNVRRLVFASSGGTIYGESSQINTEESGTWPLCHYAVGKLTCEKLLQLYNHLYGMENISLRISNPYGLGQDPNTGVGAITVFVNQILQGKSITIYGDGNATRDFVNVDYVVQAFEKALNWKFDRSISPVFNIGSGKALTLKQVVALISRAIDEPVNILYQPRRSYDVQNSALSIEKAIEVLRYSPPKCLESEIIDYAITLMRLRRRELG